MHTKSSLESIQIAWGHLLRDFRMWCKPEGKAMWRWKTAPLKKSIMAAKSTMIDDAEAMLTAWAKHENDSQDGGQSAFMPVMTTAIAPIQTPPEVEQVVGHSPWLDVVLPHDVQDNRYRKVKMRTIPAAFRCQIAYFSPDLHGAMWLANQFCAYFTHEGKRTFDVVFDIGVQDGKMLTDTWRFRVLDNSLYPDSVSSEYKNLSIVTVDCTIVGTIPSFVGLDGEWDVLTDTLEAGVPDGHEPMMGQFIDNLVVSEQKVVFADDRVRSADIYDTVDKQRNRVSADDAGEIDEQAMMYSVDKQAVQDGNNNYSEHDTNGE